MKESTLTISLLCLGCFLATHKVNGYGGDYPDVISIWNTDPNTHVGHHCLGQYSKMPGKYSHGKPVYGNNDRKDRFFFVGKNGLVLQLYVRTRVWRILSCRQEQGSSALDQISV